MDADTHDLAELLVGWPVAGFQGVFTPRTTGWHRCPVTRYDERHCALLTTSTTSRVAADNAVRIGHCYYAGRMQLVEAMVGRRSIGRLTDPAPGDDDIRDLLRTAATVPDHGALRPWRLISVRGQARDRLGTALAASHTDERAMQRAASKPLRAPLLLSIVFCPVPHDRIASWEQLATTSSLVYALSLLLHERGWGSIWRSGDGLDEPPVRETLGLGLDERLLGWLYVGTPASPGPAPRPTLDVDARLTALPDIP